MQRACFERITTSFIASTLVAGIALAAEPSAKDALSPAIAPIQKTVDYSQVPPEEVKDCRVESVKEDGWAGWYVLGPGGERLRRFADTNNDKSIDLWCYYQAGVEVYRDIDSDYNGKADQYRWLGTAGSRWGIDADEDGKIDQWKRISAEEVSQELVRATANRDDDLFQSLLLTSEEAKSLKIPSDLGDRLGRKLSDAREGFTSFANKQAAITTETRWAHFVASQPGVITDTIDKSGKDELLVYENVVAMFDTGSESGQLFVGTLIKLGDAWRVISVPQIASDEGIAQNLGFFFSAPRINGNIAASVGQPSEDIQKLVGELEAVEQKLVSAASASSKAKLHDEQAIVLEKLISASDTKDRGMWIRQMTETVSAAIHGGEYPRGLARLERLSRSIPDRSSELAAYVSFELISAEYGLKLQDPKADFAKVQDEKIKAMMTFVGKYPSAEQSAKAMMDLALSKEFENEDKDAISWYRKVITKFSSLPEARKAQGAIRRLDAIGNRIEIVGVTLDGKSFDLSKVKGRPVIVHYWATWCETCKADMKLFRKLQAQYAKQGLTIIGINVDAQKSDALAFVRENSSTMNWPQLFAEGGLESSPLANVLGVQTLPTTLVIDKQGKVATTNVVAANLEDEVKTRCSIRTAEKLSI